MTTALQANLTPLHDTKLTTNELMQMFDVSFMTIYNWRHAMTDKTTLPCHYTSRGTTLRGVYFIASEVLEWAKKNNVTVKQHSISPTIEQLRQQLIS